jgi:hypothetical protein
MSPLPFVHLSSQTLGISGILDVIEEKEGASYPVETKHGSAPRDGDAKRIKGTSSFSSLQERKRRMSPFMP